MIVGGGLDRGTGVTTAFAVGSLAISILRPVTIWSRTAGAMRALPSTLLSASFSVVAHSPSVWPTLPQILTLVCLGRPLTVIVTGISTMRELQLATMTGSNAPDGGGASVAWAASSNANGRIIRQRLLSRGF